MRTVLCALMVLIASAGICVRAESDEAIKIAQADPNAPAATPGPAQSGAGEQKLVGMAAWNKLVGNSISGTEDGQLLTEYYAPHGKIAVGQRDFYGDMDACRRSDLLIVPRRR